MRLHEVVNALGERPGGTVRTLLCVLLTVCFASNALAQAPKQKKKSKKTGVASEAPANDTAKKAKKASSSSYESSEATESDSSERARDIRKNGVGILYTPLSDFVLKYGATGFHSLSPKLQLSFNFLTGTEDLAKKIGETDSIAILKADASGMAIYGAARYFFGNSFNAAGGLGYRTAEIKYLFDDKLSAAYLEGSLSASSVVLQLSIGNHWQWSNGFFIGCDWLAAMVPLSSSAKSEANGNLGTAAVQELNDFATEAAEGLAKATSLHLLVTQVGYSF